MNKIRVSTLPADQIDRVKPLLEKSRQKPYRFLLPSKLRVSLLNSFWLREIEDLCLDGQGEVFIATEKGKTVGTLVYSDLPWDTRIVGVKMGTLKYIIVEPDIAQKQEIAKKLLSQVMEWAVSLGIEFLLCRTYGDDLTITHMLEQKGFLLMDTLLDYVYDLQREPLQSVPHPPLRPGTVIRSAVEDDIEELIAMAQAAFRDHFGRFHSDERIPRHRATQIYEEWMRSSCQGYADWILVAEVRGKIAGCSVWKKPSSLQRGLGIQVGHYSIGAIHPDYHGQGLFSALTRAGMELFDGVADYIEGPTDINNHPVQRAYTKLHWRICDARYSFHKWLVE